MSKESNKLTGGEDERAKVIKKPMENSPTIRRRKGERIRGNASPLRDQEKGGSQSARKGSKTQTTISPPSRYFVSGWIFGRGMSVLYAVFFYYTWQQIHGLLGSSGISPISEYLDRIESSPETSYIYYFYPTIFWIVSSDDALDYACMAGLVASLTLFLDIASTISSIICWILALSICVCGQEFFMFQSDLLLLEMGFLFIFLYYPSWNVYLRKPVFRVPSWAILWSYWILLFRILFVFGVYQFFGPDTSWQKLSFFNRYFEVQCTPNIFSRYLHNLPLEAHQAMVIWVLTTEILMPFLILTNVFLRKVAGIYIILLEVFYLVGGNTGTWHFSLLLLSVLLFDDSFWARIPIISWIFFTDKPKASTKSQRRSKRVTKKRKLWKYVVFFVAVLSLTISIVPLSYSTIGYVKPPQPLLQAYKYVHPWRIVNLYVPPHLQSHRKSLVIQASYDAHVWKDIGTVDSPDYRLDKEPPMPSLRVNRLEHKLWEASYSTYEKEIWLSRFLHGILSGSEPIRSIISADVFPDTPDYVRASRYLYEFDSEPNWWKRESVDIFTPSFSQTLHSLSGKRKQFRARKNKRND